MLVRAGINGFVAASDDPDAWAALMLRLSDNEAEWQNLSTNARDGAHRGDVARFVESVVTLLATP